VSDREILETYLNSASKSTPETDIFFSWDKIFVDQCYRPLPRYYVTAIENVNTPTSSHTVNINIKFVSHNDAKERCQLILNLLCKM